MQKNMYCNPLDLNYEYRVYGESGEIRTLTLDIHYYFRVNSFNSRGITEGSMSAVK